MVSTSVIVVDTKRGWNENHLRIHAERNPVFPPENVFHRVYTVEQKDNAFQGLLYGWSHGGKGMTDEEEDSLTTLMQAHISEWSRRRAYELIRIQNLQMDEEVTNDL